MHSRNAKLGLKLFSVYLVLYVGFVGINTFSTSTMELKPFAGINLAIWYGFVLIVAAILLALIYGFMCDPSDNEQAASTSSADAASDQEGGQA